MALLALGACGADRDAVDAWNRGFAALQDRKWREADQAAEEAEPGAPSRAAYLRGCAVIEQALLSAKQANTPEAEPFVFDVAMRYVDTATRHWQTALMADEDGPFASALRRNIARAAELRWQLEELKKKAEDRTRRPPKPDPKPRNPDGDGNNQPPEDKDRKPPPRTKDGTDQPEPESTAPTRELTREEVLQLLQRLSDKEREKTESRTERKRARTSNVERDW